MQESLNSSRDHAGLRDSRPAGEGQKALWRFHRLSPDSPAYNMAFAVELRNDVDTSLLCEAFSRVVRGHEALSSGYAEEDGDLLMRLPADLVPDTTVLEVEDWSDEQVAAWLQGEADRPFVIEQAQVCRLRLLTVQNTAVRRVYLCIGIHHIAGDFLAFELFGERMFDTYARLRQGEQLEPFAPGLYWEWLEKQRQTLEGPRGERLGRFWREEMTDTPPVLELSGDFPRTRTYRFLGDELTFVLDEKVTRDLKILAQSLEISLFGLLGAAFQVFLHRHSGQDRFLIGTPTSGRSGAAFNELIGYTLNAIPWQADLRGNPTFAEFARMSFRTLRAGLKHQRYPLSRIAGLASGDEARGPLFRHMVTLVPRRERPSVERQVLREFFATQRGAANEMNLRWQDSGDRMIAQWRYDSDRFRRDSVERMVSGFQLLLSAVLRTPDMQISLLEVSLPEHRSVVTAASAPDSDTAAELETTALQAFKRQVRSRPDHCAVVDGNISLTYRNLDAEATRLSRKLRSAGVGPGARLAVMLPRSARMAVAMLAAWKVGAAYLCLDPGFPVKRLAYMVGDSGASVLLGCGDAPEWLGGGKWLDLDAGDAPCASGEAIVPPSAAALPAYVIYTSGSTGMPKGVEVGQGNLLNYVNGVLQVLQLPSDASLCALASVSTDLGYTAWFGALLSGRTLRIVSDELASDPEMLARHFSETPVDCLKIVPSHLKALMAVENPARLLPLRCLVLGGEALDRAFADHIAELAPGCRVINHYGPTEATVGCLTQAVADSAAMESGAVSVGTPLSGGRAVVLDPYLAALPIGAIGELAIGGSGIAAGYLQRPGLTAERFVPDPFAGDGSRLYRTGDRVRMRADGSIEFLGRVDDQVKIRGFRVEPGEVEAWLKQRPELADAAVVARPAPRGDGLRLLAYVVPAGEVADFTGDSCDLSALRKAMADSLLDAMVPSAFVVLEALPRLLNGKIDRQALPEPESASAEHTAGEQAPRSAVEETLLGLWADVLGRSDISVHDNFFDLGGDSIIGLQLVAKARPFGLELHPKQIFERPTIAALAQALDISSLDAGTSGTAAGRAESILTAIWQEVLQRDSIDRNADFFDLGGDSILALQIIAKIQAQNLRLTPKALFEHRSIAALAVEMAPQLEVQDLSDAPVRSSAQAEAVAEPFALSGMTASELEAFRAEDSDLEDIYPLSPLQQGLLFHSLLDAGSGSYVNQLVVEASGRFDPDLFAAAWQSALDSHPILRTTFRWESLDTPLQCVHRNARLPVSMLDWRDLDDNGRKAALQTFCANDRMVGFALERAPLMRLAVARVAAERWWLIWSRHHLIVDGWCSAILLDEVLERYRASLTEARPDLAARPTYRAYIDWLSRQDQARASAFWRKTLSGVEAATPLPFVRAAGPGAIEPIKHRLVLDEEITARLQDVARTHQVTLNTLLQAAWGMVLSGISGQDDVVFGVTSAGRPPEMTGAENILGVFINTLPLRVRPMPALSLREYLAQVQSDNLALREFEYASLADIQAQVTGGAALFDTIMVFQNLSMIGQRRRELDGLELRQLENIEQTHYGVTLEIMPEAAMVIEFTADRRRIDDLDLTRLANFYRKALSGFADPASSHVGDLELLDETERQLLRDWATTAADYDLSPDWTARVEAQAQRHPDRIVARCGEAVLSYGQLWQCSGDLARGLNASGVGPDTLVALLFPRGLDLLTMIVAVLRAGGAWLPLDPDHPPARWTQVRAQAGLPLLVCDPVFRPRLAEYDQVETLICAELLGRMDRGRLPTDPVRGDQLAYVIFTSGSTGTPKGAMVTRDGMLNNMLAKVAPLGLHEGDVIAQTASACFDISVWQTLTAPLVGACVEILPDEVVRDPEALLGVLQSRRISLFEPVPSLLQALLDIQEDRPLPLPSLRWVLPTGEALPPACARAWFKAYPDIPLMNAYGPAECADDVAFHALYQAPSVGEPVPIGAPTSNAELYILNSECNILPIGTVGEIAVGGVGVGRGYLGDPRRTAAVFVPNPAGPPGSRLYLTGDLGRWRANGTIEFVGRNDFQIKLRGFRIEPGEIEALVENHDRVKRALVTVRRLGGSDQLVAYWEPGVSGDEALEPQLSADLAERLPAYMVPGIWVKIDHWPLNANGKIDQSALPVPQVAQGQVIAAETETERRLIAFWQDILPEATLGRDSDFFASGGHSLLATRLIARLRRDGYAELPLRTIFDASTIRTLAERLDRIGLAGGQDQPALVPVERGPAMPLSLAQQRLWLVERLSGSGTASYNMSATLRLRGVLDVEALQRGLDALLERHEVLRTGYPEIDGEPVAVVNPDASVEMTVEDLSALSGNAREERIREADQASARTVFDIAEAPLLRARLLRLDDREHLLLFAMHHLVADGWSVGVMIDELAAVYRASLQGHSSDLAAADLPALPVQYADYAVWQRNLLTADRVKSETDYWRKQLSGVPPLLNLPVDHPRPAVASHSGDVVHFEVSAKLLRAAELLAQAHGATAFMVLLAAFQLHLHRLANSPDVVVGTDTAGRGRSELEGLIGFFVNVVPLRSRCEPGADFISLLTRTRQTTLDAFEHEALPFDRIVEAVGLPRDRRFNPLVQALFVLQNVPSGRFDLPGLDVEILPARERYSKFDTALFLEPRGETLAAEWVFATALFDQASVQRFAKDWLALLEQVLESPQTPLDNFALPIRQEEVQMDHTRRMSAKLDRLKKITRPAEGALRTQPSSPVVLRNPVRTSFLTPDSIFPVVVEPAAPDLDPAAWAGEQRRFIEATLCRHAAILFRNFGIAMPQEFEAFAEAIEPGLFGSYGDLPKKEGGKNIYRSTPYPERQMILYHNESSHLERWPRKQWFFCEQAAPVGGATPIVDCREMLRCLPAELVDEFERKQLTYIRTFTKRLDVGWRDFFKTDDKAEVEARCRAGGIDCRWLDEETLQTRTRCPAVIRHPITSERSFFNQVQLHHTACLDAGVRDDLLEMVGIERLPRQVVFGDGTPIPDDIIEIVGEAYEACAVRFDWQPGDVVMLDNMLAAHARDPFEGPRKIVVAMGDMVERAQIIPAGENTPAGQASTLEPILQE